MRKGGFVDGRCTPGQVLWISASRRRPPLPKSLATPAVHGDSTRRRLHHGLICHRPAAAILQAKSQLAPANADPNGKKGLGASQNAENARPTPFPAWWVDASIYCNCAPVSPFNLTAERRFAKQRVIAAHGAAPTLPTEASAQHLCGHGSMTNRGPFWKAV